MARRVRLETTAMATDGRAVARDKTGRVVFVAGALPGETVDAEVFDERSRWSSGQAVVVIEPSPDRVEPPCPHVADGCGGCQWQHVGVDAQRRLKASLIEESLIRTGGLGEVVGRDGLFRPTVELDPWHWRTTVRVGVEDGRAAFRQVQSHNLVPIDGCLIAHPLLVPLLCGPRFGSAESVLLRCGARTGELLAVPEPRRTSLDVPAEVSRHHVHEIAAGRRWRVSAKSFFQSRPDGADALANLVSSLAGEPAAGGRQRAVDAYCGVGLFAGVLAERGWSVTAVEGSRASVDDARHNLAGLPVEVVHEDVRTWHPVRADLVVADPSRAGLGRDAVARLSATGAWCLILISCDVASLGRDAALLTAAGFSLTSVTPVDLFPHSWHVEVVSLFDRSFGARGGLGESPAGRPWSVG